MDIFQRYKTDAEVQRQYSNVQKPQLEISPFQSRLLVPIPPPVLVIHSTVKQRYTSGRLPMGV